MNCSNGMHGNGGAEDELYSFLRVLDDEFKLCEANDEGGSEEKRENISYYANLKEDKGIDVRVNEFTTSLHLSKKYNIEHSKVIGMIKKLETLYYVINHVKSFNTYHLTEEGMKYVRDGSPEYVVLKLVLEKKKSTMEEVKNLLGKKGEIGLNTNLKNKLIQLSKSDKSLSSHLSLHNLEDKTKKYLEIVNTYGQEEENLLNVLKNVHNGDNNEVNILIQDLKKRKLLEVKKNSYSYVVKTSKFKKDIKKQITDLNYLLLRNDEYAKYDIKKYNFFSSGKKMNKGNIHLLTRQMRAFKDIFISLGFEEMDTQNYVESSFWCFDALYIPQQHPSRDLQDTFFIKEPEMCADNFIDSDYIANIEKVHTFGDYGSFGWNYKWKLEESKKNVLRTHTTANSCRTLFKLAKEYNKKGCIIPKKYFSIDRVFRNENLDSTHLAEFHQIEGLIIDKNLGLSQLISTLSSFYKYIGIHKLKFKPTFNPYTEPSMEIYGYHEENKKWLEVGNSGVFRPEMLRSMGFEEDVSVIAWGLSLERPTMIKYNIKNIRDLFGYKSVV
ncbi:phenylalanine--tRNA ligase alpha subunit [Plasmodium ovale wallikeri]|uniref:phenylalanine--tRNA ligase n=2 Tax=Plasmodium ovale TaxID=36330 RepID=A0A1A8YI66_PLAOA|nr:phenylalanine--tRNA ligase alpha subunit [Plasmodium ovale wallikeri]SBT31235.1 phenylalanine--tRNA ligase alpha subunit [Plasmodium ovale wallikeri]SBT75278.1 phenylalanine--tRNA ligase alpha subunit, putative [Plasmodium ovale]